MTEQPINTFWFYIAQSGVMTTLSDPLSFIQAGFFAERALFQWYPASHSYNSLHSCLRAAQFHHRHPLLATQQLHRSITYSLSSLLAASPIGFHSPQNSLFQKPYCSHSKLVRRLYITVVTVAYWANCALRLHRVTVHQDGSSINWKSVFYSGGMIKMWCAVFSR